MNALCRKSSLPSGRAVSLLLAALAALAVWVAPAPELVAGGKTPEPSQGVRQAYVTFLYRRTIHEEEHIEGGVGGVGEDKKVRDLVIHTTGRFLAEVPDENYLDPAVTKYSGPDNKMETITWGIPLMIGFMGRDLNTGTGTSVKSYFRQTRVAGQSEQRHFAMNTWGPPAPKWVLVSRVVTRGNQVFQWPGQARGGSGSGADWMNTSDIGWLALNSIDAGGTFNFNFQSHCPTVEIRTFPVDTGHFREVRYEQEASDSHESVEAVLRPASDEHEWQRRVQRTANGLMAAATRSKTKEHRSDDGKSTSTKREDEQLEVRLDMDIADYEIVITPPAGLNDWIPHAGSGEQVAGDRLRFKGKVQRSKGRPAARDREIEVRVELSSSRVPGICMNWPRNGGLGPDMRILREGTDKKLKVTETLVDDEQATYTAEGVFKVGDEFTITVGCYDYGAYGDISFGGNAPVRIEGREGYVNLQLPTDTNHNHISDAWQRKEEVFDKKLPATWDEVKFPSDHRAPGDGICLYERYRGFQCEGLYERLKCDRKYVFIHDPDRLVRKYQDTVSFGVAAIVFQRFVDNDHWSGAGSAADDRRIINFNHGSPALHKVDQHALHVADDPGQDETYPAGYQIMMEKHGMSSRLDVDRGVAWYDYQWRFKSPAYVYQVSICTGIIREDVRLQAIACMPGNNDAEKKRALLDYELKHPSEFGQAIDLWTAETVAHEFGHAVGINHHVGPTAGSRTCLIRYPSEEDAPLTPADPFWLRRYAPFPSQFCKEASHTANKKGCFKAIKITDYEEK